MRAGSIIAPGLAGIVAAMAAACGGADAPARQPVARPAHHERVIPPRSADDDDDDGVEIEGLKGHLDQADIQAGVEPHHDALTSCFMSRVGKRRFLGGQIELAWRIARDGSVKEVQIAAGDLGAWPIEKCLLEVSRSMTFARPKGGLAEFSLPLDFPPRGTVLSWDEQKAQTEIEDKLPELAACDGAGGEVVVTLYVGTRGQVQSVGFSSPGAPYSDAWADCAAEAIGGWTLSDPRGQVAKLAFRFTP